jgi:hypothetical protein
MMAGHMTPDARAVAIGAYKHAIRLGHRYLGGDHFLLALASADQPAGAVCATMASRRNASGRKSSAWPGEACSAAWTGTR